MFTKEAYFSIAVSIMDGIEDETDWSTDFTNGDIPYKQKQWINLYPLKLILQLKYGELELTRGKSYRVWQDESPRIWSKETLLLCLDNLLIEVQSLEDKFILRREEKRSTWSGFYTPYRRHIIIDQEHVEDLIKGNSIVI